MIIQVRTVDGRLYEGKVVDIPYGYRNPVSLLAEKTIRLNEEGQEFFLVTAHIVAIQEKKEEQENA
jgi:hypothetical protein